MSDKKYKVAVHGLMKKNGQMAGFGDELNDGVHIDDAEKKVEQGFLLSSHDFDTKRKEEAKAAKEAAMTPADAEKAAADAEKAAADAEKAQKELDAHNGLLDKYRKAFNNDAPEKASDEQIADAIKNKTAIQA